MASDYGTSTESKTQLSGYFDVNNEKVTINKGYRIFGPCTKKKKCYAIAAMITAILVLIVIIAVAVAVRKHKLSTKQGEISSLRSGNGCTGHKDLQNQCISGECIQKIFVCDGFRDCPGGEDEVQSLCDEYSKKPPCKETQFKCLISRDCIDIENRCNGKYDCGGASNGDYSDERKCFSIDKETETVSVNKRGDFYAVKASIDTEVGELICKDLGFRSLQSITSPQYYQVEQRSSAPVTTCASLSPSYVPTNEISGIDDELVSNMNLGQGCSEGVLSMACSYDFCGVFENYTGPDAPYSWISPEKTEELKKSKTKFPWVADIFNGTSRTCKATIVSDEWVLTPFNCIKENIFFGPPSKSSWKVVAGETTDSSQERDIIKVMKNNFEESLGRKSSLNFVAVQVYPPFDLNNEVRQVCLAQPAFLPHFNCFASATPKLGSSSVEHVRVILKENSDSCKDGEGDFCYEYPHAGDDMSCLDAMGSPISCLDPAKNSWTLAGIATSDIGCGLGDRQAASMADKYNFYWADIITAPPVVVGGTTCGRTAEFQEIRLQSGNRQGEVYIDVLGWGSLQQWHTLYNLSSSLNILEDMAAQSNNYATVKVANNSGITSHRVAFLKCPSGATSICSCKFDYRHYSPQYADAPTLHFIDDANENGRIDSEDFEYENWDEENIEDLYEEYENYAYEELIGVEDILPQGCSEAGRSAERQCLNSTDCVKIDYICDGFEHCDDGSDEDRTSCERFTQSRCPDQWFKCRTTYDCIPRATRCDDRPQCADHSDERECVTVLENDVVMVEKNGFPLPLGGMPPEASNETEQYLATALCKAMGFGTHLRLTTYNNGSADFSRGCYKFLGRSLKDSKLEAADFAMHPKDSCDTTLALICKPPGCGVTLDHPGPNLRKDWPQLQEATTGNKDYPWLVHIMEDGEPKCAATIVQPEWIVTTYDCITNVRRGLTAEFTDWAEEDKILHNITRKANYRSTRIDPDTGAPLERNIAMFGVYPPFSESEVSSPLCVLPPLYTEGFLCYVSGHDQLGVLQSVRVVLRDPQVCEDAGLPISQAVADEQCVEYLDGSDDTCIKARGGAMQCLDTLRDQWKFTAVMTMDFGRGCSKSYQLAVATSTQYLTSWMFDMVDEIDGEMSLTCKGGDLNKELPINYHKSNFNNEWYMMTSQGEAIDWAGDEEVLARLAAPLVSFYGAFKVTSGRTSQNITAVTTILISDCEEENQSCRCSRPEPSVVKSVEKFFLVSVDDQMEAERDRMFLEEEDAIADYYDYDYFTTPIPSSFE